MAFRVNGSWPERLWARVRRRPDGCWLWDGAHDKKGYGNVGRRGGRPGLAHVAMYELMVEPVPEGLELDHLCRNPGCVNPSHLEPVTHRENMQRGPGAKTHCKNGHERTDDSVYVQYRNGVPGKRCRICYSEYMKVWRQSQKGKSSVFE